MKQTIEVYVPNLPAMSISFILHKYRLNHGFIRCLLNRLEQVYSNQCDLDQRESSWNIYDPKLHNFCSVFSKILLPLRFSLSLFIVTFHVKPLQVISIVLLTEQNMWQLLICYRVHDGSLSFHPSAVINITHKSGNISTTIQNYEGGVVLITVSWYGHLVEVENGWLNSGVHTILCVSPEWVCDNYQIFYRTSCFSIRKRDLSQLFHIRHPIPIDTFPKCSGQQFFFFQNIVKASWEINFFDPFCSIVSLAFFQYSYLTQFCCKKSYDLPDDINHSQFFSCGITLSLLTVMFTTFSKRTVIYYAYDAHIYDTLVQLPI